ncbi:MAG: glycosyltransferase [Thermodesulfobacteriota bacterium]
MDPSLCSESQIRQLLYAKELPAKIVIINYVKNSNVLSKEPVVLGSGEVKVIPCVVPHWSLFPLKAIRIASHILMRRPFDLIQVQEPFLSGMAGLFLSRRFKIPLVAGVFSDEIGNPVWLKENTLNKIANMVGKRVLKQAAIIRTDSQAVTNRLKSIGFNKVVFIPFLITNAALLSSSTGNILRVREDLLDGSIGPLLLGVFRLEKEKNIPMLLEAFSRVTENLPGARLVIAGDGSLRHELEYKVSKLVPGKVKWLGRIPNEKIPAIYQAADLVLLASNVESSARVLTESLLAGTPVLTTDTAGAREVIEDGKSGRVVPVGDVEAFALALNEMCQDMNVLKDMGRYGQRHMMSIVTKESVMEKLRHLFNYAVGGQK